MSEGRRETAAAAAALLLFHLAFALPCLVEGGVALPVSPALVPPWSQETEAAPSAVQDFSGTDRITFTLPNLVHWRRSLAEDRGGLLWNPYTFAGTPFLATQDTCALYPPNLLFLAVLPEDGFLWTILLHGWIASFGAFLVLRRLRLAAGPAMIGAIVFGGSGWFIGHADVLHFIQPYAWIPLMALGAEQAAAGVRRGAFVLAVATALSFLGGMAQITAIGLLQAGLVALARAAAGARGSGVPSAARRLLLALGGVALGLGLAAAQLLPTFEIAASSGRRAQPLSVLAAAGLRPLELYGAVHAELFGSAPGLSRAITAGTLPPETTEEGFALARLAGTGGPGAALLERLFYPGIAALALALAALLGRWDPRVAAGAALLAIGLGLASGGPLFDLAYLLPGFQLGNPRRFLVIAVGGLAVLAAAGAERARAGGGLRRLRIAAAAVAVAALSPFAAALAAPRALESGVARASGVDAAGIAAWIRTTTLPGAVAALAVFALALAARRLGPGRTLAALALVLAADLAWLDARLNPPQPAGARFGDTEVARLLRDKAAAAPGHEGPRRVMRFREPGGPTAALPPFMPNLGLLVPFHDVQGYEGLVNRRIEELADCIEPGLAEGHARIGELSDAGRLHSKVLDLLGVRWVLATAVLDGAGVDALRAGPFPVTLVPEPSGAAAARAYTVIVERPGARGFVQAPRTLHAVEDGAAAVAALRDEAFDPDEVLVIEAAELAELLAGVPAESRGTIGPFATSVAVEETSAARVVFRYDTGSDERHGLALVAQAWHPGALDPGWKARREADGREIPVVRADHALQALLLPPGRGRVILEFRPASVPVGAAISGASLLLLAVLGLRRTRRPAAAAAS